MSLTARLLRRISTFSKTLSNAGEAETLKSNILSISGLESVKKGDFVKIGQDRAWVYALFKDHVLAAVLSDRSVNYEGHAEIDPDFQLQVPTDRIHEGQSLTAFMPNAKGQSFQSFLHSKAPYHHLKSIKQLLTGYHQVDVCQPISLGQTVLFYGKANQGQSKLTNETAEKFLKSPQHKVVICSCSPSKKKKVFENSIHYTTDVLSSDVSQCFTPYIALAHAAYLRDQGHHVLFILEDLLHHAYKERSLFHAFKIMPSNIGSLTYEHSKHITPESSLTSIVLLDEQLENDTHRMLTLGLGVHMRSISSQVYNFTSLNETIQKNSLVLDFTKICQTTFNYQIPVFQKLREALQKIFTEVKEISDLEEARKVFGIGLEPWDKYLVLDSKYFVKFLCQDLQLSTWETIVFCEFVVYSVRNELISMFKIEMHELKKEFLKYVKGVSCEAMLKIANNPESPDADWILNNIDENVIKRFYVEAKMRNWLKDYKDDYDELMGHTVPSGTQKLVTPDLKPSEKTVLQQFLESNLILKNK